MNCDDAFDALTDPSRADAAELELHLANCPRCRALQNVLEPALSLLCGELPAEPSADTQTRRGGSHGRSDDFFLSVEAVHLAETTAAQLRSSARRIRPAQSRRLAIRKALKIALHSAALLLFGGLVIFCIGPWSRDSERLSVPPLLAPTAAPYRSCTRTELQRSEKGRLDPSRIILACVACHLKDGKSTSKPVSTSLLWQSGPSRVTAGPRLGMLVVSGGGGNLASCGGLIVS